MGKLSHNVLLYVIFSQTIAFENLGTFLPNLNSLLTSQVAIFLIKVAVIKCIYVFMCVGVYVSQRRKIVHTIPGTKLKHINTQTLKHKFSSVFGTLQNSLYTCTIYI
jgi:hypothetical protein